MPLAMTCGMPCQTTFASRTLSEMQNVPIAEAEKCLVQSPFRYTYNRSLLGSPSHEDLWTASSRNP